MSSWSEKKGMSSWSDLPHEILERVAKKLRHIELLQFGSVCKPWRFLYLKNRHRLPKDLPILLCWSPLLLRSCKQASDSRNFVCVVNEKVQGELFLPECANKWVCGSSWGWLVTVGVSERDICLLNPFTRDRITLPSLARFPQLLNNMRKPDDADRNSFYFIKKVIISEDPTSRPRDCVVMAIVGNTRHMCFCNLGDVKWTYVKGSPGIIEDVTFYQGRFYAVTQRGLVVSFDGKNPNAEVDIVARGPLLGPDVPNGEVERHLIASGGDLLQVRKRYKSYLRIDHSRNFNHIDRLDVRFEVFKLIKWKSPALFPEMLIWKGFEGSTEYHHCWSKLEKLEDRLLFIGFNGSFSLPAFRYPNCKGSRIYFSDDCQVYYVHRSHPVDHPVPADHDFGVFDLEDKSCYRYCRNEKDDLEPTVWFIPNFC